MHCSVLTFCDVVVTLTQNKANRRGKRDSLEYGRLPAASAGHKQPVFESEVSIMFCLAFLHVYYPNCPDEAAHTRGGFN